MNTFTIAVFCLGLQAGSEPLSMELPDKKQALFPATVEWEMVTFVGQQVPGEPAGQTFAAFGTGSGPLVAAYPGTIDEFGNVGFSSVWFPPQTPPLPFALWVDRGAGMESVAATGDPMPGSTFPFSVFPSYGALLHPQLKGGTTAFLGSASSIAYLFWDSSGTMDHVLPLTTELPGTPVGTTLRSAQFFDLCSADTAVVETEYRLPNATVNKGLWRHRNGVLEAVMHENLPAPGTTRDFGDSASSGSEPISTWGSSPGGCVAFSSYLQGNAIRDQGVWVDGPSGLQLVVREGDAASGPGSNAEFTGGGSGWQTFDQPGQIVEIAVNDSGHVVFVSKMIGDDIDYDAKALWTNRDGSLRMLASEELIGDHPDDDVPGLPGAYFQRWTRLDINNRGTIVVQGFVELANGVSYEHGIWTDRNGTLKPLVVPGDAAPGVPGATFVDVRYGGLLENNHVYFCGELQGPGIDESNDLATFVHAFGKTRLVMREGDQVFFHGTPRTIDEFVMGEMNPKLQQSYALLLDDGTVALYRAQISL